MKEYIVNSEEECLFYKHDELIRCKDCKYWQFYDSVKANVCKRRYDKHYWQSHEDDFCSRAERKEK